MLRNKLKYLLLLFLVGILSILYNIYYTGVIFLTMSILPFLLFGILCYCYGKIKSEMVTTVHVANKGDQIPITIQLNNPTIFPVTYIKLYLTYQNAYSTKKMKKTVTVSIDCRTKTSVIYTLSSECAGNLLLTLEAIRIYDYFKLFSLKRKLNKKTKIAVLPYYYEISESNILKNTQFIESDCYHPTKKGDDPSEVFAIREYREGDRLQRIHWKLSSKMNQLMIKEFSDPLNSSILLFVNLCIPKGEYKLFYMDAILECALSLSYSFVMKQQAHYLCWTNNVNGSCTRIRITQEEDLFEAVDGLLNAIPYENTVDMVSAYLAEYPHEQYANTYFVTGEVSMPWITSLAALQTHSRQMIYIKTNATQSNSEARNEEALQQLEEIGMEMWSVEINNIKQDLELLGTS